MHWFIRRKSVELLKLFAGLFVLTISFSLRAVSGDEYWDNQFGLPGPEGADAIVIHNGLLYTSVDGAVVTGATLKVWDGLQWSSVAQFTGPFGTFVDDLAFVGETLCAAGNFTSVNGIAIKGLARWDGVNWSSVNNLTGIGIRIDGRRCKSLCVRNFCGSCGRRGHRDQHRHVGWKFVECAR